MSDSSAKFVHRVRLGQTKSTSLLDERHEQHRARLETALQWSTGASTEVSESRSSRDSVLSPSEAGFSKDDVESISLLAATKHDIRKWSRESPEDLATYVGSDLRILTSALDPFDTLPTSLDTFTERLVNFWILIVPRTMYAYSPKIKPGPTRKSFSIGLTSPGHFYVNLARAALHRISLNVYSDEKEKRELEVASLRFQGEALKAIRTLSAGERPTSKDDLLAVTHNIALLSCRYSPEATAEVHLGATRRLIRQRGGPLHIENSDLEHIMLTYEAGLMAKRGSTVWSIADFPAKLGQLNEFLEMLHKVWQRLLKPARITSVLSKFRPLPLPYLQPTSVLYYWLTRDTRSKKAGVYQDIPEYNHQMASILILASIYVDMHQQPIRLFEYKLEVERRIRDAQLDAAEGHGSTNIAYIMQDTECCLRSDDFRKLQWAAVGLLWVTKFLRVEKKVDLKDWLVSFLTGVPVQPVLRYTIFDFSYAV